MKMNIGSVEEGIVTQFDPCTRVGFVKSDRMGDEVRINRGTCTDIEQPSMEEVIFFGDCNVDAREGDRITFIRRRDGDPGKNPIARVWSFTEFAGLTYPKGQPEENKFLRADLVKDWYDDKRPQGNGHHNGQNHRKHDNRRDDRKPQHNHRPQQSKAKPASAVPVNPAPVAPAPAPKKAPAPAVPEMDLVAELGKRESQVDKFYRRFGKGNGSTAPKPVEQVPAGK